MEENIPLVFFQGFFLASILPGILWSSWIFGFRVWHLWKVSVITVSNMSSFPFSFLLVFLLNLCYPFCSCLTFLGYSILIFLLVLFLFAFWFEDSVDVFSNSDILFSALCVLLISPSKAFLIYVIVFLYLVLFFWSLEFLPLCLPCPSVLKHCLLFQ